MAATVAKEGLGNSRTPGGRAVRIEVQDLSKTFGSRDSKVPAVDRVSFDLHQGEFVALLGPSGCGKSTILNMIAGLIPHSAGEISVDGEPVKAGRVMPQVGYVFQRDTVFAWRTVARNIGYGLEIKGVPKPERQARVARMIAQARLNGFEDAFPLTLSGGMRQRVSLMRTLIMEPQILLMDEPFGALDTHTKLEMHQILLELWERERQTVIFVTHDLSEALTLADRIILLSARPGRIKEDFAVPFPRPRDAIKLRETGAYGELFAKVWQSLGEEFAATKAD
jgi:NitT/TauT family transport system ATP-binding protein